MMPFLFEDLGGLIKALMLKIVKSDKMDEAVKAAMLVSLTEENFKDPSKVEMGFCARLSITNSKASDRARHTARNQCRDFISEMIRKILLKGPVKYPLVKTSQVQAKGQLHERI